MWKPFFSSVKKNIPAARVVYDKACVTKIKTMGQEQTSAFPFAGATITISRDTNGQIKHDFKGHADPEAVAELGSQRAGLEDLRQQRDAANAGLTESKVALATEEQMSASFQQQKQSLVERLRELAQILDQRRGELSSFESRRAQAQSEIQESRGRIESL